MYRKAGILSCSRILPTGLCCVLQGPLGIGAPGQNPVKWVGAGRHWVDGSSPGQESPGSFAAADSAWYSL